jgi:NAD-dependent SIR2 family protein deacetylase
MVSRSADVDDRVIELGPGLPKIPERLLLAHARGHVLFIAGSGVSLSSGLPDFRGLTLSVYAELDKAAYAVLSKIPEDACNRWGVDVTALTNPQAAEVRRFIARDFDVVLGMLERRLDGASNRSSQVRKVIAANLRGAKAKPARIHRALMKLSDRGAAIAIATTNFEHLLERAATRSRQSVQTYALGGIPRPSHNAEFHGVMHIHGAFELNPARSADLVVTDQDFGEFYLRRRNVSDFIYDAARLYHIVLVGYSANDPPMRYLLNAVAGDVTRFEDLKERFTFFGSETPDQVTLEDWRGRGITPIHYDSVNNHTRLLEALERWATLSAINGKRQDLDGELSRIVKKQHAMASDGDRDLFDHLIRRSEANERVRISALISRKRADISWLNAITAVCQERERGPI